MLPHGHRHERLADQIRIEVAEMIEGELEDPRIGFATVTHVDLSPDLRHARVLVSVLGSDDAQRETLAGLTSAAGYVRREIAQRLRLRRAPELVFDLDREGAQAERVELLLKDLQKEE
jgi:ribosome-binding factor A